MYQYDDDDQARVSERVAPLHADLEHLALAWTPGGCRFTFIYTKLAARERMR